MNIVVIDDDRGLCRSLQLHLERAGHTVKTAITGAEGLAAVAETRPQLVFVDLNLPDRSGLDIVKQLKEQHAAILPVMITGMQDARATIDAIKLGAFDYIRKPLDLDAVMATVEKAKQQAAAPAQQDVVPVAASGGRPYEIIGGHPAIIDVLKKIGLFGASRVPVLIVGESGTGKELVARAIHDTDCPGRPFVAFNCSAIVPTLLESELFGHVKGAFTGADANKPGKLELAGNGTIFLDEIGDMSFDLQAKLLRVLQEHEFERVGGTSSIPFEARVVAATNKDLERLVAENHFREDLYYRLAVSTIRVPALRERRSDIPLLTHHLVARIAAEMHKDIQGIDEGALRRLQAYDWPGNIRELVNVLTRAVLLSRSGNISEEVLRACLGEQPNATASPAELLPLWQVERDYIEKALLATDGNITRAAECLEVSRVTLRKKISDYGIDKPGRFV